MPSQQYNYITDKAIMGMLYARLEQKTGIDIVNKLALKTSSNSVAEEYGWLGQVPQMREWIGPRTIKRLLEQKYTLRNVPYEATLGIAERDRTRDKTGQLQQRMDEMIQRSESHWYKLMSALILSNGTCYDGQNFFSTAHSEGDSGTQVNACTSSHISALNIGTAGAPTAIEMKDILVGMAAYFMTYYDDQKEPINEGANNFLCMVPTVEMYTAARTAVNSNLLTTSGGAAVDNDLKGGNDFNIEVVLNTRLRDGGTDYDNYLWMFRTDSPAKPFIAQEEQSSEVQLLSKGSDYYFKNKESLLGIDVSRACGYGMWQYAIQGLTS